MDDILTVTLPHGLFVEGRRHQDARLRVPDLRQQARAADARRLPPAHWASRLLAQCVVSVGDIDAARMPDLARTLTVGDREALLLHLIQALAGDPLRCAVDCPHGCGERMDVETTIAQILVPPYPDAAPWHDAATRDGGEAARARFRVPTGADQEAAVDAGGTRDRIGALLDRITESGAGSPSLQPLLDARLAELDPQAEILFDLACTGCGRPVNALFDAAAHLMHEIRRRSDELEWQVHCIALHYHWSEHAILALDEGRRTRYIQRILNDSVVTA